MELKLFVEFKNQDVLSKVMEFIDEQWKHNIKLIRDFEVAYVDEYEDAQYGTVYAVTDDELNLIGVFAKHEPFTYREVAELVREDSGESGDIVLFDITSYTGLDYNMPEYFKGYKGETDAFLEAPIRDSDELLKGLDLDDLVLQPTENSKGELTLDKDVGHVENLPRSISSSNFKMYIGDAIDELERNRRKVEEKLDEVENRSALAKHESDMVNKPSHYTFSDKFEIIDVVEEITSQYPPHLAFAIGNAVKYIARSQHKNGKQDIEKSIWYLQRVLEKYDEE